MSVARCIILSMTNELVSSKYTFVCDPDECDSLIELTSSDGFGFPSGVTELTCPCGRKTTLLSVVNATITPSNQTKEETMETTTKTLAELFDIHAKMIVKSTTTGELEYLEVSPYDVNCYLTDNAYYQKKSKKFDSAVEDIKAIILDSYADSDDQDTLRAIAEALEIKLTKTVEWSATMYVSGSMEVDLLEDFDLDSELSEQLQVSAWSGDIEVEDYSVDDVREN
jgi:hypothetical protein